MEVYRDCFGREVRLTDERKAHILEHPEMAGLVGQIGKVLTFPALVRRSRTDPEARLFYEFYAQTVVGGKWLCVVVKYPKEDGFVVTAYLTDQPKFGEELWPKK